MMEEKFGREGEAGGGERRGKEEGREVFNKVIYISGKEKIKQKMKMQWMRMT